MDKEYIGLLGVITGGVLTYGVSYLKMRHDDKKEKRKLYTAKLEEAHKIVTEVRNLYRSAFADHIRIINHGIKAASGGYDDNIPIDDLKMIIEFYAPRIGSRLKHFEEYRNAYGNILAICLDVDKLNHEKRNRLKQIISDGSGEIEKLCSELQKELSIEVRKYL